MFTQKKIMEKLLPIMREKGIRYKKFNPVIVRKAKAGEVIETVTDDGVETRNVSNPGDFIIRNQTVAGEEYIVKPKKFAERYRFKRKLKDGFSEYEAKGSIMALEMDEALFAEMNRKKYFRFIAPWGEHMLVRKSDFMVCPMDYSEVYRVARKEFFETYQQEKQ